MERQYKPEAMPQPSRTPSRGPLGPQSARSRGSRGGAARLLLAACGRLASTAFGRLIPTACGRLTSTAFGLGACLAAAGCSSTGLPVLAPPEHGERVLVVAPHIDDEAIAAGGYAADAVQRGAEVYVVYMTAGDCNRFAAALLDHTVRPRAASLLREGEARIGEGKAAMARLGVPPDHVFLLGYPDGALRTMLDNPGSVIPSRGTGRTAVPYPQAVSPGAYYTLSNLDRDLARVMDLVRPTTVIAPVPFDRHPDHATTGLLVRELVDRTRPEPRLLGYLVHSGHFPRPLAYAPSLTLKPPARFADDEWREYPLSKDGEREKARLLALYKTQKKDPYLWLLLDAFVRRNELYVEGGGKEIPYARAAAPAAGRAKEPATAPAH
jgi:LmbE family N-acetylglucosaminyl deacetylase